MMDTETAAGSIRIDPTFDETLDLVLERFVDVPPALVWRAWTEPELIKQWFAPRPWRTLEAEIDPRPGGIFRTVMAPPDGEPMSPGIGCILEANEGRRLTWTGALAPGFRPQHDASGMAFTAIISLEPRGGGTNYTAIVKHMTKEGREKHAGMGFLHGWGAALDQLVELMRTP